MSKENLKIMLTGGGTLGSVTPLIAVWQEIQKQEKNTHVVFVGTHHGVEKTFVKKNYDIEYVPISSGKLRRYISVQNIVDIFKIFKGFFDAYRVLKEQQPSAILTAGSFVSVPLVIVGAWLKIPIFVHQLDIKIGLANKIMARFAKKVTITFGDHLLSFPEQKVILTGSPIRQEILSGNADEAQKELQLNKNFPTLLVLGGGIGAKKLNDLIERNLKTLLKKYNIIHSTGTGKKGGLESRDTEQGNYRVFEFINKQYADYLALADLIVTRAGLATLSEIIAIQKPMLMIPIHNHQQEENAIYFQKKGLGIMVEEVGNYDEQFLTIVSELIENQKVRKEIKEVAEKSMNRVAASVVAQVILREIKK